MSARYRIERREASGTRSEAYRLFADYVDFPRQVWSMADFEWQLPLFAKDRGPVYQIALRVLRDTAAPLWIMPFEERDEDPFSPWIVLVDPPLDRIGEAPHTAGA